MMPVQYLEDHYDDYVVEIDPPKRLHRVRMDGYGQKIPTSYVVKFPHRQRTSRVYATCWSNVASFWVQIDKAVFHLHGWDFNKKEATNG